MFLIFSRSKIYSERDYSKRPKIVETTLILTRGWDAPWGVSSLYIGSPIIAQTHNQECFINHQHNNRSD